MLKVRKDAIKVKTSEGMQSAGVLCNVGTFGLNLVHNMVSLEGAFHNVDFETPIDLDIYLGKNINTPLYSTPLAYFAYGAKNIRSVKLKCNNPNEQSIQFSNVFFGSSLEVIDLSEFVLTYTTFLQPFRECRQLVSIHGKMDFSAATNYGNAFMYCENLVDVEIKENSILLSIALGHCKNLSDKSIQSIIDGLSNLTGQTAQTIIMHSNVKAKLTDEQLAQITSKNWTLA